MPRARAVRQIKTYSKSFLESLAKFGWISLSMNGKVPWVFSPKNGKDPFFSSLVSYEWLSVPSSLTFLISHENWQGFLPSANGCQCQAYECPIRELARVLSTSYQM